MTIVLLLISLLVIFHALSYAMWAWQEGNKRGGGGLTVFSMFTLAWVIYMIFFREAY